MHTAFSTSSQHDAIASFAAAQRHARYGAAATAECRAAIADLDHEMLTALREARVAADEARRAAAAAYADMAISRTYQLAS